nr:MAG TPA: hypothetical protein [Bacteriophage sp.]
MSPIYSLISAQSYRIPMCHLQTFCYPDIYQQDNL